mgnify:CR=1 FL=1
MKKNNSRKPFFSEDKKDFDSPKRPDFSSKGSKFNKSESKPEFKGKSFGKKEDSFDKKPFRKKSEDQPTFGDKPKGRFFKDDGKKFEKPAFGKRNDSDSGERKPFGEKRFDKFSGAPKKWEKSDEKPFGKICARNQDSWRSRFCGKWRGSDSKFKTRSCFFRHPIK